MACVVTAYASLRRDWGELQLLSYSRIRSVYVVNSPKSESFSKPLRHSFTSKGIWAPSKMSRKLPDADGSGRTQITRAVDADANTGPG